MIFNNIKLNLKNIIYKDFSTLSPDPKKSVCLNYNLISLKFLACVLLKFRFYLSVEYKLKLLMQHQDLRQNLFLTNDS